ncbi:type IV pilus biogenesis protein PilM [Patescibacteria group bacterium]
MSFISHKNDYFALSFSDFRVRLAQVGSKGRLRKYLQIKLETGIIERGQIKQKEKLSQALVQLLKSSKIKHKFVIIGLPEVRAFTRTVVLPLLDFEEINEAVRWESEPVLPFPLDKAYLDWMILQKSEKAIRLLAMALPQELVDDYVQLLEELDLQPIALEATSLSLARLVEKSGQAAMVVEVRQDEAILVVVGPGGGVEVSSTLTYDNESEAIGEIEKTVSNVLHFYRKKVGEKEKSRKVNKILFSGEKATTALAKKIRESSGVPSALLSPNPKEMGLFSLISLAKKKVASPVDEKTINLIPPRIQGFYDQVAKVRKVSSWAKLSLLGLLLAFFSYSVTAAHVYFEMKRLEGEIIELQAGMTMEAKRLEKEVAFLNLESGKIINLAGSEKMIVDKVTLIRQSVPEEMVINHIAYDDSATSYFVDGFVSTRGKLLLFRQNLESSGQFFRVHIPLSSLEKEENVNFTVTLVDQK